MSRLRTISLLCCLLLLGACSSTTFFYNRLDFIIPWYLDDYVELDREQGRYLDGLLIPFLDWHRLEELPRYVEIIEDIETGLDQPVTGEDVAAISLQFEEAWYRLQDAFLDWLLALGDRLSEEQVQSFLAELWERQEEYEDKYLDRSDEEFRKDSYESLLDNMQDYLGRLDQEQRELLRQASEALFRTDSIWLGERAAWLKRLEVLMQREPGWQQRVREAIAASNDDLSPEHRQIYNHNLQVIHDVVAEVINSRSEKQDRRLRGKLSGLREDFQTLIAQGQALEKG